MSSGRLARCVRRGGTDAVALLAGLLVATGLAGCADSPPSDEASGPAPGDLACRTQWRQLGEQLRGRDEQAHPSDLAGRWTTLIATAHHYQHRARASDCAGPLRSQRASIDRVQALSDRLRVFDVPYRAAELGPVATAYLLAPRPRRAGGHGAGPPSKGEVRRALALLQAQATLATTDMVDGWTQAGVIDLSDPEAVERAIRDLRFLAGDSAPYQACLGALKVLDRARDAQEGGARTG